MNPFWTATLAIAALVALVPLCVWGASGSWRHAVFALKRYSLVMGVLVAAPAALALISFIPSLY